MVSNTQDNRPRTARNAIRSIAADGVSRLGRHVARFAVLGTLASAAGLVLAQFPGLDWRLSDLSELKPHIAFGGALAAFACFWLRRAAAGRLGLLVAIAGFAQCFAAVDLPPRAVAGAPALRIAAWNALWWNKDHESAIAWLRAERPDLVAVVELSPGLRRALGARLADLYPYRLIELNRLTEPDADGVVYGMALLSRLPFRETHRLHPLGRPDRVALVAAIEAPGGGSAAVAVLHPPSPQSAEEVRDRDRYLGSVLAALPELAEGRPLVAVGDFNATPWGAGLKRAEALGWQRPIATEPTWPAALGPFGIPIDLAIAHGEARVIRGEVGPALGSDHRAVTWTVALPNGRSASPPAGGAR